MVVLFQKFMLLNIHLEWEEKERYICQIWMYKEHYRLGNVWLSRIHYNTNVLK